MIQSKEIQEKKSKQRTDYGKLATPTKKRIPLTTIKTQ